jgi:hypothetical protein
MEGVLSAFLWPVQMVQAAAKRFDLPLVGVLLPLGQFERFQYFLHVLQCFPEGLDNLVDLFDGLLNGGWPRQVWRPDRWRGSLPFGRGRFGNRLSWFRYLCRAGGWLLGGRLRPAPPATPAPAAGASAAPRGLRRFGWLRRFAGWLRLFGGSHFYFKVP